MRGGAEGIKNRRTAGNKAIQYTIYYGLTTGNSWGKYITHF